MKVAIIYNKDLSAVINKLGMQNKEVYNPQTVNEVANCLIKGGHNVAVIDGDMHVIERIKDFMPSVAAGEKMGMVFNMAYGIQGESRYTHIPSLLEMLGIPYLGSSPSGHAFALDKAVTKIILQNHNLPTPKFWVMTDKSDLSEITDFPLIVKPKMESVSFGLSLVYNHDELLNSLRFIVNEFLQPALVEEFIPGREFAVGLLGNNPVEVFPILEIDLENDPYAIQTYESKKINIRKKICPANLDNNKYEEIISISRKAFESLQLKDFARVDLRMDSNGNVFILELNSMASLGHNASYTKVAEVAGYNYCELVNKMLDVASLRYFNRLEEFNDSKKQSNNSKIRGFILSKKEQTEAFLKDLVNINTFVRNVEGVNLANNLIKKYLTSLGFSLSIFHQIEIGNTYFYTNTEEGFYDYLIVANIDNDTEKHNQEFFSKQDHRLFGTGIWENKGGVAILIAALQALKYIKALKKIKIGILITTDDTLQGRFSSELIHRFSDSSNHFIGMHGAEKTGALVSSRSGSAVYNCSMHLINKEQASDAAFASSYFLKIVNSIIEFSNNEEGLIITPNNLKIETDVTEPFATGKLKLSVRFNNNLQLDHLDIKIKKLLAKRNKKVAIEIEGGIRRPPLVYSEKSMKFFENVKMLANTLDINISHEHRWSSADICFVKSNIPAMDGFGPVGEKPFKKSEYILQHSLFEKAALLAKTLLSTIE